MDAMHQYTTCRNTESSFENEDTISEISVIIPVNGDKKVSKIVQSVLNQRIRKCEILVIRNSHISYEIEEDYPHFAMYPSYSIKQILLVSSGKAKTLNYGIRHAKYGLIAVIDADCVLEENALRCAMDHFRDDSVFAVGGRLVVLPHFMNLLTAVQIFEYDKTFNISRRVFNCLNCNFIISGAFGVFRKESLLSVGCYDEKTVGEDLELILRIHRLCKNCKTYKVIYEHKAVCYTEAPRKLKKLLHQRERWQRGFIDSVLKNKGLLFKRKYGLLGMIILPFLCFEAFVCPVAIILGSSGLIDGMISHSFFWLYLSFQVVLSLISKLLDNERFRLIPFLIGAFFVNVFGMFIQFLISFARLFGTLFFKRRRMRW